jgi:cyclopropane fatty-acyl-phospholipid synthase-like methyltransferase
MLIDKLLQKFRFQAIAQYVKEHSFVLDIGTDDGALFNYFKNISGVGIDPQPNFKFDNKSVTIEKGSFPGLNLQKTNFDAIVMLAVLEHIPKEKLNLISDECRSLLKIKGLILITVPSKKVDFILRILKKINLIDAETLDEHHGFEANSVKDQFNSKHFQLLVNRKFQFGLNNLFVFEKIA